MKARPFPAEQDYSPAVRQYLNRLSGLEANNDTQFQAITVRLGTLESTTGRLTQTVGEHEERLDAVESDVGEALVDILQLQQESASHAEAIDLLNSRYELLGIDLDGAIQAIGVLSEAMDQVEAVNTAQAVDIAALTENVADLLMASELAEGSLIVLGGRVTGTEDRLATAETDIQALQYADISLGTQLGDAQARIDYLVESQLSVSQGTRLPLSAGILGTIPKMIGALFLPTGEYAAPSAYLGCPTTPSFTASLNLCLEQDGTVIATVDGPGTMTWQTATAGFSLEADSAIDLLLVGSSAPAVAIIKGLMLTQSQS